MGLPMPAAERFAKGTQWVCNEQAGRAYSGQIVQVVGPVTEDMQVRVCLLTTPAIEFDADLGWLD